MCIAVPGQIKKIKDDNNVLGAGLNNRIGIVEIMGVVQEVSLGLCPQAKVGDYVLIHAGAAIDTVSTEMAKESASLLNEIIDATGQQIA